MERRLSLGLVMGLLGAAGCGAQQPAADVPPRTAALPTAGIAAQKVAVFPLTLLAVEERLAWEDYVKSHEEALDRADSMIGAFLSQRAPEVEWVSPADLARAAKQAPQMLTDPHRMGTAMLRSPDLNQVPDPLRSQMRTLTGIAAERYALVPASLFFVRDSGMARGRGRAELMLVLVDVRTGRVGWRTVARGEGDDPWAALWAGLKPLVPGIP